MHQIEARNLTLGYGSKQVVKEIDLTVRQGEFISIIGPSGVGKSTLLLALNATTAILGGELRVLGNDLDRLAADSLKRLRARIGVIFQGYNLVNRLSVLDNIAGGMLPRKARLASLVKYYSCCQYEELYEYMKVVGLEDEALSRCDCLSGGQRQRVAIARAIAQRPEIILADEPISALDPISAHRVMETLRQANRRYGITVVSNLHQLEFARDYCTRIIGMSDGRIVFDGAPELLTEETVRRIYQGARPQEAVPPEEKFCYYPGAVAEPVN